MRERCEPIYTTRDAVDYLSEHGLHVVPDTVRMWVRTGRLSVDRTVGGQYLYTRVQLDALIASRRERARV